MCGEDSSLKEKMLSSLMTGKDLRILNSAWVQRDSRTGAEGKPVSSQEKNGFHKVFPSLEDELGAEAFSHAFKSLSYSYLPSSDTLSNSEK